jgi:hypothetical protein
MKFFLCNAFSINMLPVEAQDVAFVPVGLTGVKNLLNRENWQNAIGHESTANLVGNMLFGEPLSANRESILVDWDTYLIVAQYTGPRLEEGVTELPPGAKIKFWRVYMI